MHVFLFFFFKQKTAYEMRISDWSSDVCSSDLICGAAYRLRASIRQRRRGRADRPTNPAKVASLRGRGRDASGAPQSARASNPRDSTSRTDTARRSIAGSPPDMRTGEQPRHARHRSAKIGRASCRERVCVRVEHGGRRIIKKQTREKKK